jgi:hypothetical protein
MQKNFRFLLLAIIVIGQGCFFKKTNRIDLAGLTREQVKIENGNPNIDSAKIIRRHNNDLVTLSFFEEFNDTLIVYLNNKEKGRFFVHTKNNPYTSSGYSGIDLNLLSAKPKGMVIVRLLGQKKYIEFEISREYPLYIIQRYSGIWYVRSTKEYLNLK